MKSYDELAKSVKFNEENTTIRLHGKDESLEFIGAGRSAFVFRIKSTNKAIKVYFPDFIHLAKEEGGIYEALQGIGYYPKLYKIGPNYIVIDLIKGMTLFECLKRGVKIKEEHIEEIDRALSLARTKGLNPSDIHLRNLFITEEGNVRIIDVARFRQKKQCSQWEDLKKAFYGFYRSPFFPKKIPNFLLNLIAALYKKNFFPRILH